MVYAKIQEITLPLRFIAKTIHFIVILTIFFDLSAVASQVTDVNPQNIDTSQSDIDYYNNQKNTIAGLTYAALACFGVEYITLFMGITMFYNGLMALNILAHSVGLVLTILFYIDGWSLDSYIAFFTVFNAAPMLLELLALFFFTRFSFIKY